MNAVHVKVFKLTKENIQKKYDSPSQELDFVPDFKAFMKQREPYNNYLYSNEHYQKVNIKYPVSPSSPKTSYKNTISPLQSPILSEPSPLTNVFFHQQENSNSKKQKVELNNFQQQQFQASDQSSNKQNNQQHQNLNKKDSFFAIHSRSLNQKFQQQQQGNSLAQQRIQSSPKLNISRNSQSPLNYYENSLCSQSSPQMLGLNSHPQLNQTKMLYISNSFKRQQTPLQNILIQQKIETQKKIKTEKQQLEQSLNFLLQDNDKQNYLSSKDLTSLPFLINQHANQIQVSENHLLTNSQMNNNYSQELNSKEQEFQQEEEKSIQTFTSRRNLFIGNNICKKGRPQSSKFTHEKSLEDQKNNNLNVSIPYKKQNQFIVRGFQLKKS
ncbi:hypothetical protein TTHERM_00128880 (macronuclear) [Tetrahymena thermophila SB210]|uniref:Uncharacterized protein n=1 Tax=Tetrahymena thermophila (strain SB210) TaxID=312017 RepID=I7MJA5_TETTS|nr:hypothetical protein TTHERM_00128880 [Tetrahymena thermophila SB210]EAR96124.1 hypothetical protein TTHERM_00128880 [Tetrahymena thermophila SB210]|eukprot:XP_001016369.1 hypothetical protein TTHERM_00128880 [Tetrahymena thermophila SB210]